MPSRSPVKTLRNSAAKRDDRKPTISIVGPGRLGSALAIALHQAGFTINELVSRNPRRLQRLARTLGARAVTLANATLASEIVWLTVSDSAIRVTADRLAAAPVRWPRKLVFHSSGALTSDELAALRSQSASVASVHPLMTFSGSTIPALSGVLFALEGDRRAVRAARGVVKSLGGVA